MKRYILPLMFSSLLLTACEKDYNYIAPSTPPPTGGNNNSTVSFSTDIQPIFNAHCNAAPCHGGGNSPTLTAGSSYAEIQNLVSTSNPTSSILYTEVNTGKMPEGSSKLPAADITKILTWIQEGAKNN